MNITTTLAEMELFMEMNTILVTQQWLKDTLKAFSSGSLSLYNPIFQSDKYAVRKQARKIPELFVASQEDIQGTLSKQCKNT